MLQLIAKSGRGRAPKPIAEALAGGRSLDDFLWRALSFEISVYFDDNSHVSFLGVGSTDFMVNDLLLFSVSVLVFLVIILMLHLTLKTDSILSECSEYRTKCDNLYHLCQMQEKELEHLRALIDAHNIDY
nr:hypothetical protein [Escherichia coli]